MAGVAPPEVVELSGWLVPLDHGSIGRAKSAVPLRHDASPEPIDEIIGLYRARGLPPAFRIAEEPGLEPVRKVLRNRGLAPEQETLVMVADAHQVASFAVPFADLLEKPDKAWGEVFLGEGFDPADGAHRVAALTRSPNALYGAVRDGGQTVAVGAITFDGGWAGIHGMRTAIDRRGAGFASRLLALFGSAALARGASRLFLQVVESNPAVGLYQRAGFTEAWRYSYWA